MRGILPLAALLEAGTGLGLLVAPSLVGQLLLGTPLDGVAVPVGRVAGLALIGLAFACWPGPPFVGMLVYSASIMLGLALLGTMGGMTGVLLWPAVVAHLILTVSLAWAFARGKSKPRPGAGIS